VTLKEDPTTVCAVLRENDAELLSAVTSQERRADFNARISDRPSADADWIWLLDGTALPCPGALATLLAAARRLEAAAPPIILASIIVGRDGRLAPEHVALATQGRTAVAVQTASLRVLPIRAATGGSLLIRPQRFIERPRPGMAPVVTWTARRLREGGGFLVPSSVARARPAAHPRLEQAVLASRLALGPGRRVKERLRVVPEICERAIGFRAT